MRFHAFFAVCPENVRVNLCKLNLIFSGIWGLIRSKKRIKTQTYAREEACTKSRNES